MIVEDSIEGIGKIKGTFVYVSMDDHYLDCGINIVYGGEYEYSLSEKPLVDMDGDKLDFYSTKRSPLDVCSTNKVKVLTKDEVGLMIKSLQEAYDAM